MSKPATYLVFTKLPNKNSQGHLLWTFGIKLSVVMSEDDHIALRIILDSQYTYYSSVLIQTNQNYHQALFIRRLGTYSNQNNCTKVGLSLSQSSPNLLFIIITLLQSWTIFSSLSNLPDFSISVLPLAHHVSAPRYQAPLLQTVSLLPQHSAN